MSFAHIYGGLFFDQKNYLLFFIVKTMNFTAMPFSCRINKVFKLIFKI